MNTLTLDTPPASVVPPRHRPPVPPLRPAVAGLLLIVAAGSHAATPSKDDADGDGVPDTAEALLYTDPRNADTDGDGRNDLEDDAPVSATDPIPADGGLAAFTIGEALVEDNYDPAAKRDAPDRLELPVLNGTDAALDGFSL